MGRIFKTKFSPKTILTDFAFCSFLLENDIFTAFQGLHFHFTSVSSVEFSLQIAAKDDQTVKPRKHFCLKIDNL